MVCRSVPMPGGGTAIVCGPRPRKRKCSVCGRPSTLECDFKIGKTKTCDRPICESCAIKISDNVDHCPGHYSTQLPANSELVAARLEAYAAFEPLWKRKARKLGNLPDHRISAMRDGYAWLARVLKLRTQLTSMEQMNMRQLKRVIGLCNHHVNRLTAPRVYESHTVANRAVRQSDRSYHENTKPVVTGANNVIPLYPPNAPPPWDDGSSVAQIQGHEHGHSEPNPGNSAGPARR